MLQKKKSSPLKRWLEHPWRAEIAARKATREIYR